MQRYSLHQILARATPLALAVQLLAAPAASALTLTDTASYVDAATDAQGQLLEVDLFDGALGTLNKVSLSFVGDLSSDGTIANISARNFQLVNISVHGSFTATPAPVAPAALTQSVDLFAPDSTLAALITIPILGPGLHDFGTVTKSSDVPAPTLEFTSVADLNSFVGSGTFAYSFATSVVASLLSPNAFLSPNMLTLSNATLTVSYDYTPTDAVSTVPLPASQGLLLAGVLGLAGCAQRRADARRGLRA